MAAPVTVTGVGAQAASGSSSTASTGSGSASGSPDTDKIRPRLARQLDSQDKTTFWVRFETRPDLSKAYSIDDWDQRGRFVFTTLTEAARESQQQVKRQLDRSGIAYRAFWATNAIRIEDGSQQLARQLAGRAEVQGLYPTRDYDMDEPVSGEDTHEVDSVEWGIANINADNVWETHDVRGEGITVANIDTGVQFDHPALVDQYRGNNGDGTFTHAYNWFDASGRCDSGPCDTDGHGTHTMGTMLGSAAENHVGVAPEANWIAANGCCPSDAALIASGEWMLAPTDMNDENADPSMRPHIINNSWGSRYPSNDPFMEDIQEAWAASGIFAPWANGNNGPGCETSGSPGSRIINYSVGAYNTSNEIASFSSRGPGQDGEIKPSISAPGVDVRSAWPGGGYHTISGTSMAAPHVAGAVALLWSSDSSLVGNVDGTRTLLNETAIDTEDLQCGGTADDNNVFGEGRLDALALVDAAPTLGALEGAVTDADTGDPIENATIVLDGPTDRELVTGQDGTYSTSLVAGDYTVSVSAFGYPDHTADVTVRASETTTHDVPLQPLPTTTVTGQISDGSGHGWPMRAEITIDGYPGGAIFSDPYTGRYSVDLPTGASYMLHVSSADLPGYKSTDVTVDLTGDGEDVPTTLRKDITLEVDLSVCTAPGYAYSYDGTTQKFTGWQGTMPQDGWTITDNVGNGQTWRFDNPGGWTPPWGDNDFAVVDSNDYGEGGRQDTSLISPRVDLSDQDSPQILADTRYIWFPGQTATVDLSVDGGATWSTVRELDQATGHHLTIPIPQAAGESDVRVRFHYIGDWDRRWELDNVFVGTRTCAVVDGGLVAGIVHDRNTGAPLNDAKVAGDAEPEEFGVTEATPDDANLSDGYYWLFSSRTGRTAFTVTGEKYALTRAYADVPVDGVEHRDFELRAGHLAVETKAVSVDEVLGEAKTRTVTFTNDGSASMHVKLAEEGAGTTDLGGGQAATAGAPVKVVDTQTSVADTGRDAGNPAASTAGGHQPKLRQTGPASEPWTDIADYPRAVMDNAVAYHDGKVYVLGGGSGRFTLDDAHVYDPTGQSWSAIADMPEGLNGASAAFVGDTLYVAGGWSSSVGEDVSNSTYAYDPGTDTWTRLADMPSGVAVAGTAVVGGKLYVVGGCTTGGCTPYSDAVYRYDPGGDTWSQLPNYPTGVAYTSCGGAAWKVVCAGGTAGDSLTATYAYTPGANGWVRKADLPVDAWGAASATVDDKLYVMGGAINNGSAVTNQGFAYDPNADMWTALPNSNNAVYRGGAACGVYKIGGSVGGFREVPFAETLPGHSQCGDEVSWLSAGTTEFDVAPGQSVSVRVTMDSSVVSQPGTYRAKLTVVTDSPYSSPQPVDVTMHVDPPRHWGKVAGTVTDDDGEPLAGVTVVVCTEYSRGRETCGPVTYTLKTDGDGHYQLWLDKKLNPLRIIAAKSGYIPEVKVARINQGRTTTVDFTLKGASGPSHNRLQEFLREHVDVRTSGREDLVPSSP